MRQAIAAVRQVHEELPEQRVERIPRRVDDAARGDGRVSSPLSPPARSG